MEVKSENFFKRHPLVVYFVLAFSFSWLILSPGVAANLGLLNFDIDGTVLTFLGGIGPLLAAIVVTSVTEGSTGVRQIFRSMFNWQVKARWWVAAVVLLVGFFALAAVLSMLAGGAAPDTSAGVYLNGGNLTLVGLLLLVLSCHRTPLLFLCGSRKNSDGDWWLLMVT
jgi:hypothetical protein